jgi:lysophospholipase L1-like esterase
MNEWRLLILLLFCTSGHVCAQTATPIDSGYAVPYYKQRLEFFRQMPDRKKEIIFLGDSHTELGEWQELLPRQRAVNRGISGDNSYGVLNRLDEVLSSRPAKVFIMIGVNDLIQDIAGDYTLRNFERIVSQVRAHSPKTDLYILSVLPVNEAMLPDALEGLTNEKIRELNRKIGLFAETEKIAFVNMYEVFADETGQLRAPLTWDGLHLKAAAYLDWVGYLRFLGHLK